MTSAEETVPKTKEGVPQWNGDPTLFQSYEEAAMTWEQGIAMEKRYLCDPRLQAELQGPAKRLVAGKPPSWLSFNGGVAELLKFLRAGLGRPLIPELTEHLTKLFKNSRRRTGESMHEYITRKDELYLRAQQSLLRVLPHYSKKKQNENAWKHRQPGDWGAGTSWASSHRSSWTSEPESAAQEDVTESEGQEGTEDGSTREGTGTDRPGGSSAWRQWDWSGYGGYTYGWNQAWSWSGSYYPYHAPWRGDETSQASSLPEILPDAVQGWYLLHDAGLDTHERQVIQTALHGDYSQARVAQELRSQWPEQDLRKRDSNKKQHGFLGEDLENEEHHEEVIFDANPEALIAAGMNSEGLELIGAAEKEVQEALAVMKNAKVTLREARMRQHKVKMARQYYIAAVSLVAQAPPDFVARLTTQE